MVKGQPRDGWPFPEQSRLSAEELMHSTETNDITDTGRDTMNTNNARSGTWNGLKFIILLVIGTRSN